jgi:hypothetical protein
MDLPGSVPSREFFCLIVSLNSLKVFVIDPTIFEMNGRHSMWRQDLKRRNIFASEF